MLRALCVKPKQSKTNERKDYDVAVNDSVSQLSYCVTMGGPLWGLKYGCRAQALHQVSPAEKVNYHLNMAIFIFLVM